MIRFLTWIVQRTYMVNVLNLTPVVIVTDAGRLFRNGKPTTFRFSLSSIDGKRTVLRERRSNLEIHDYRWYIFGPANQNTCVNWYSLESHPENSGHLVGYYCSCQCLGSSHMVIVRLVLQPPLCGISCRQMLEMRRPLKCFNLF